MNHQKTDDGSILGAGGPESSVHDSMTDTLNPEANFDGEIKFDEQEEYNMKLRK